MDSCTLITHLSIIHLLRHVVSSGVASTSIMTIHETWAITTYHKLEPCVSTPNPKLFTTEREVEKKKGRRRHLRRAWIPMSLLWESAGRPPAFTAHIRKQIHSVQQRVFKWEDDTASCDIIVLGERGSVMNWCNKALSNRNECRTKTVWVISTLK